MIDLRRQHFQGAIFALFVVFCTVVTLQYLETPLHPRLPLKGSSLPSSISYGSFGSSFRTGTNEKRTAFCTFLARSPDGDSDCASDNYCTGARILTYQLLHNPSTRSDPPTEFVVFVTDEVNPKWRKRLALDGATIIEVEHLRPPGYDPEITRWKDVFGKFRLWEQTQFDTLVFLDADTILFKQLSPILQTDAVTFTRKTGPETSERRNHLAPLPESYSFAAGAQWEVGHTFPPESDGSNFQGGYFNAGFMVIHPDVALFKYYESLIPFAGDLFGTFAPEQDLLNHAHRKDGPMPWEPVEFYWNVNAPTLDDVEMGAVTIHEKWWIGGEWGEVLSKWRWLMEGYFEAWEVEKSL